MLPWQFLNYGTWTCIHNINPIIFPNLCHNQCGLWKSKWENRKHSCRLPDSNWKRKKKNQDGINKKNKEKELSEGKERWIWDGKKEWGRRKRQIGVLEKEIIDRIVEGKIKGKIKGKRKIEVKTKGRKWGKIKGIINEEIEVEEEVEEAKKKTCSKKKKYDEILKRE